MSANKLVMCPYDEAHKVKESRLQLHITKCRQNHLSEHKFICPFNATHVYPIQEKDYHLSNCADRAPLDRRLVSTLDMNNPYKGRTAVPSYSESQPVISDEVWDVDSTPRPGYQPPSEPPANAIFQPPPMSKPSERRRMYQILHQRQDVPENKPNDTYTHQIKTPPAVKQPKQPSEPSILESQMQNLGLGRGRGTTTRIAANIFPQQQRPSNSAAPNANYSAAISSGLSQLGLGRGKPSNPPGAELNSFDDDDFPALGCGRGMSRAPRNTNSYAGVMNAGNRH